MKSRNSPLQCLDEKEAQCRDLVDDACPVSACARQQVRLILRSSSGPSLSGGLPKCSANSVTDRR